MLRLNCTCTDLTRFGLQAAHLACHLPVEVSPSVTMCVNSSKGPASRDVNVAHASSKSSRGSCGPWPAIES